MTKQELLNNIDNNVFENTEGQVTPTNLNGTLKNIVNYSNLPERVNTYADMLPQLRLNQYQRFTVLNDEFQGNVEKVPYEWDGTELFVYGTLVEPQPTITQ